MLVDESSQSFLGFDEGLPVPGDEGGVDLVTAWACEAVEISVSETLKACTIEGYIATTRQYLRVVLDLFDQSDKRDRPRIPID